MNYLAHLLTAGDDTGLRYGVLLGDHLRGRRALEAWPRKVQRGVHLHRAVDSFTDRHSCTAEARALFRPPFRRYANIMLDVYFDHLLSRHWPAFCSTELTAFGEQALALMAQHREDSPPSLRRFEDYARATRILERYAEPAAVHQALGGIGRRLRRSNPLHRATPALRAHDRELERLFLELFPEVVAYSEAWRRRAA